MLHSHVSCCTCFMLLGESGGVRGDSGMTRAPRNRAWRVRGRRSGCACGAGRTIRQMGASRIEVDRVDYACKASHPDAWVERSLFGFGN